MKTHVNYKKYKCKSKMNINLLVQVVVKIYLQELKTN
jgi:hypothetical protein